MEMINWLRYKGIYVRFTEHRYREPQQPIEHNAMYDLMWLHAELGEQDYNEAYETHFIGGKIRSISDIYDKESFHRAVVEL